ncbi:MAG: ABC transporter ATP-binding protein [Clostridiales bacterium]|nr:ABC transporter ATP-binding protein [Clostridiales bacterium]
MEQIQYAVEMQGITKTFGKTVANNNVCLSLRKGEILALLGENGSGKTTLMNMLSGIYFPDSGEIRIHGEPVTIRSPKEAFDLGIGMIHQHFKLVDVLTAAENIVLGLPGGIELDRKKAAARISEISGKYGFEIEPNKKIYNMAVSEKQTVEIIKVLYRGADILILDEPTAVLTPQETKKLFDVLRAMKADGKSIIIITHKLHEVLDVSDRVAILRKGEYICTIETKEANQQSLTEAMVGRSISLEIARPQVEEKTEMLKVENLTCINAEGVAAVKNASFTAYGGEILGVAGVAGSGQKELCEAIAGLYHVAEGSIRFKAGEAFENIVGLKVNEIFKKGISLAFVPEDRLGMGLVGSLDMVDNMLIRSYKDNKGIFVDRRTPKKVCEELIDSLEIVTPGTSTPVRRLSGGNVQKVLLGREIHYNPRVLMVSYPVRGLDINSSYKIYDLLNEQKKKGVAVIFVGEDLDVLMEISDRIMVICGGEVSGIVDPKACTKEDVGLLMVRTGREKEAEA